MNDAVEVMVVVVVLRTVGWRRIFLAVGDA